jgi:hypothetical protein
LFLLLSIYCNLMWVMLERMQSMPSSKIT